MKFKVAPALILVLNYSLQDLGAINKAQVKLSFRPEGEIFFAQKGAYIQDFSRWSDDIVS